MKQNSFVKYLLMGIGTAVVIFLILIFIRPLLHAGETTGQLVRDPYNWLICVFSGAATGWSMWRKNNKA